MTGAVVTGAQKPADQCWVNYSHRRKLQDQIIYICVCIHVYITIWNYMIIGVFLLLRNKLKSFTFYIWSDSLMLMVRDPENRTEFCFSNLEYAIENRKTTPFLAGCELRCLTVLWQMRMWYNTKMCFVYEWNMKKFLISITSDNINISSATLALNAESNILKEKFLVGDKEYWIWGKVRMLNIGRLENNAESWRNMVIVYKYLNIIRMKD